MMNHNTHDTQWQRWEVFKQDTPQKPHQAVGSVHAGDPEHALLTARNVFARRPLAVSMWVAPADRILSRTLEEAEVLKPSQHKSQEYVIFSKNSHKRAMTFVDYALSLEANSPEEALQKAQQELKDALVWWVVAKSDIYSSDEEDTESWFAPAKDKTYKQQSAYGLIGNRVRKAKGEADD
ncbi:MAG: phenylacetic acid degradation protein [Deinococcales bacterium]